MNAPQYRCEVHDFVFDLLNCIKEQIGSAIDHPSDQRAATDVASDVVPLIYARLMPEHELLRTSLQLSLSPYFDNADGRDLASLGEKPRDEFLTEATELLKLIDRVQTRVLTPPADQLSF